MKTETFNPTPASRLRGLRPYSTPAMRWPIDLALDANEGPAQSAAVVAAMGTLTCDDLRRYPKPSELEALIASHWSRVTGRSLDAGRVVVTSGGDDAIDRLCRALLEPDRALLLHSPTFEMIARSAQLVGAEVRAVDWLGGDFPTAAMVASIVPRVGLVALVSPNNPTGGVIEIGPMLEIIDRAAAVNAVVMIDLAYAEFAESDPTAQLLDRANVVIVRTFSKGLGLAGLRLGYAVAQPQIAEWMRTAGAPYPVSAQSLATARAAINDDGERMERITGVIRDERVRLDHLLRDLRADPLASQANFVTARLCKAAFVRSSLASLGIAVRGYPGHPVLAEHLRITLPGDAESFDRLECALVAAMQPQALLLDMDGVIADVEGSYRSAIVHTAATFGVKVSSREITEAKRAGNANNDWMLTRKLLAARGVRRSLDEVVERFQGIYLGLNGALGLREQETCLTTPAVLRDLASRCKLAIVTGRPRKEAEWFLDRFGLRHLFSEVVCMEDAPAKPSPEPVLLAMRLLAATSGWMIGDTPDDLRAARAASGCGLAVVPIGIPAPADDLHAATENLTASGAARVLTSLDELLELLP